MESNVATVFLQTQVTLKRLIFRRRLVFGGIPDGGGIPKRSVSHGNWSCRLRGTRGVRIFFLSRDFVNYRLAVLPPSAHYSHNAIFWLVRTIREFPLCKSQQNTPHRKDQIGISCIEFHAFRTLCLCCEERPQIRDMETNHLIFSCCCCYPCRALTRL